MYLPSADHAASWACAWYDAEPALVEVVTAAPVRAEKTWTGRVS
jgi:hypothetical protein